MADSTAITPEIRQLVDQDIVRRQQTDRSLLERSARRGAQDVLSTPGVVVLPRAALAGIQYLTGINETFGEGMMVPEARELYGLAEGGDSNAATVLKTMGDNALVKEAQWAKDWYEWGGEIAGTIDNPDGSIPLDEEIGGIGLTAATAIPTGGTSVVGRTLSGIAGFGGRLANSTAARLALRIAELSTPVTIGATPANMAANFAVGTAINDAARTLTDEETLYGEVLSLQDDHLPGEGLDSSVSEQAALGATAAGVAAAGLALGRPGRASKVFRERGADTQTALGAIPMDSVERLGQALKSNVLDDRSAIKQAVTLTRGTNEARAFDDIVRSRTGNTVDAQIDRAYNMGMLSQDGSERFHKPLNAIRETFRQMPEDVQKKADDTYAMLNELSNRRRGLRPSMYVSTDDLLRQTNINMSNPVIGGFVSDVDQVMRKVSDWRYKEGVISRGQWQAEKARGHYMPEIAADVPQHWIEAGVRKLRDGFMPRGTSREAINVAASEKQRLGGIAEHKRLSEVFDGYIHTQLREVNANSVRRELLNAITDRQIPDRNRMLVRKLKKGEKSSARTVTVRDTGNDVRYDVGDPRLFKALQFRPRMAIPVANSMRKMFQRTTTGSLNPLFAPISAVYDMTFAALGTRSDRVTGPLDTALKRVGAPDRVREVLAGPVRVADIPMTYMQGVFSGLAGRYRQMQAERLADIAAQSGHSVDQAAAQKAADTFMNTMYGTIHRYGRTGGTLIDMSSELDIARQKLRAKITDRASIRWYNHVLDSVRDGMQMGLFTRNYAETVHDLHNRTGTAITQPLSEKEIMRLANDVRKVSADPTNQAGWQAVNAVASTGPYANIILQSIGHLVHTILTNRSAQSTVAFIGAVKYGMSRMLSDEQREHYEQTMPAWERVAFLPIPTGDTVDDLVMVPLGPELGGVTSITADMIDAMFASDQELQIMTTPDRIQAAFVDLLGFAAPPIITVPLSAYSGTRVDLTRMMKNEGPFLEDRSFGGVPQQRGIGLDQGWVGDRLAAIVYAATGVTGRALLDSAEALLDHPMSALNRDAWDHASGVMLYEGIESQRVPRMFTDTITTDPRVTPLSNKAYQVDQALKHANEFFRGMSPEYDQPEDVDIPHSPLQQMIQEIQDPMLQTQAVAVNEYFYSGDHGTIMQEIGQLHEAYRRTKGHPTAPPELVASTLNDINRKVNDRYKIVLANYGQFEQYMREDFGDPEWTIGKFVQQATEDATTLK